MSPSSGGVANMTNHPNRIAAAVPDGSHKGPPQNRMILWGEEEQGSERSFRRKAETETNGLCDDDGARGAAP